jgi:hypothetical protein
MINVQPIFLMALRDPRFEKNETIEKIYLAMDCATRFLLCIKFAAVPEPPRFCIVPGPLYLCG